MSFCFIRVAPLCNGICHDVGSMETYSSWVISLKEKCVSADLMHLVLVRFVTIRLKYIYWLSSLWIYHYFEYIDCNIWFIALVNLAKLHPFNAHIWKSSSPNTCLLPNTYIYDNGIYTHMFTINDTYVAEFHQKMKTYTSSFADKWGWEVNLSLNW